MNTRKWAIEGDDKTSNSSNGNYYDIKKAWLARPSREREEEGLKGGPCFNVSSLHVTELSLTIVVEVVCAYEFHSLNEISPKFKPLVSADYS